MNEVSKIDREIVAERIRELCGLAVDHDVTTYIAAALAECPEVTYTHELVWGGCVWASLEHSIPAEDKLIFLRQWVEAKRQIAASSPPADSALVVAAQRAHRVLASLTDTDAIQTTTAVNAYVQVREAELALRQALAGAEGGK